MECILERNLSYGNEVIFLGRIVAVSVDRDALKASDPYACLQLFVFLEAGHYGVIEKAWRPREGPTSVKQ